MSARAPYLPLGDYGLIGDCRGAALVARDGGIDWCCFERFDAEPVFARLLDAGSGGHFSVAPENDAHVERAYEPETNILVTTFRLGDGIVRLTDFMALTCEDEARAADGPRFLIRMVEVDGAPQTLRADYAPSVDFGRVPAPLRRDGTRLAGADGHALSADIPFEIGRDGASAAWKQAPGERRHFILQPAAAPPPADLAAFAERTLAGTRAYWRGWTEGSGYHGPYRDAVLRSALVLKLMTYGPSGAIVAAPTTSLPEEIGGIRNWDYRYCWPRDACFAFYALKKLGHIGEAEAFFDFLTRACRAGKPPLPPLFPIDGNEDLDERLVEHLEGYRSSRPVRAGNEAAEQHQADVYGQILDLMHLHDAVDPGLPEGIADLGRRLADHVAKHWREPDAGLWEPRLAERRHVHSAMMSWAALDRAIALFGAREDWVREREAILAEIRALGAEKGRLTQTFDNDAADGALLLAPMLALPIGDDVLSATLDRVEKELGAWPLVYRYRNDDGLGGEEGSFLVCAFWMVDALLALGRGEEARERFEALLARGSDLGLYPEEMAEDGTFLGNFPQALTHLGLIQSALLLDIFATGGAEAVRGTYADRALFDTQNRRTAYLERAANEEYALRGEIHEPEP